MNMRKNKYKKLPVLRGGTCLLLQCGMLPLFAALAAVYIEATRAPLHVARAAQYGEMLQTVLASLALLTFGALVGELAAREGEGSEE